MDLMKNLSKWLIKAHYLKALTEALLLLLLLLFFQSSPNQQIMVQACGRHPPRLFNRKYIGERAAFSMHLDETFNKRSLMQISMILEEAIWVNLADSYVIACMRNDGSNFSAPMIHYCRHYYVPVLAVIKGRGIHLTSELHQLPLYLLFHLAAREKSGGV